MNDLFKYIFFVWCLGCHNATVEALIVGSNTAVSRESHITFPAVDTNNKVRGFAWLEKGFTLEDNTTTCTFNGLFPVAGTVNLNGGTLTLQTNLIFQDEAVLGAFGSIEGKKHFIDFSPSITFLRSSSSNDYWKKVHVTFSENVTLSGNIKFLGNCFINGNGFDVTLDANTDLVVGAGAKLTLENIVLKDISGTKLRCLDDTAFIVLDNVIWLQDADYSFTRGYFKIRNTVHILDKRSGAKFIYQSPAQSEIKKKSTLILDESITFSYDPIGGGNDRLLFKGNMSELQLNGATFYVTTTDLLLTVGRMRVTDDSIIASETAPGITLGDSVNTGSDFFCKITSGVTLTVTKGTFNYKNVQTKSWKMKDVTSRLNIEPGATLKVFTDLDLGKGVVELGDGSTLAIRHGRELIGSTHPLGLVTYERFL